MTTPRLPENFRRVRLELAREPQKPEGDSHVAYVLVAPLDAEGQLDSETYRAHQDACTIVRMRAGEEPAHGKLRHRGGGWAFHYDFAGGAEDDDPVYRLRDHKFVAGEYVTIMEDEGPHTYRVAWVREP